MLIVHESKRLFTHTYICLVVSSFKARVSIIGSFCMYRKALYFWSFGISLYLELFCFLSFITIVLRNLCSGTHRRNRIILPRLVLVVALLLSFCLNVLDQRNVVFEFSLRYKLTEFTWLRSLRTYSPGILSLDP